MNFTSSMAAKEFIVSRIVEEASRRQVGLSELERKMLLFSEGFSKLQDMMEVNERFEATYNSEQYAEKIRKLSRQAFERDRKESLENAALWRDAIRALGKEDHYILLMLDLPGLVTLTVRRPRADSARLVITGLVAVAVLVAIAVAIQWAGRHILVRIADSLKLLAFALVFALGCYFAFSDNGKKFGDWLVNLPRRVARWF